MCKELFFTIRVSKWYNPCLKMMLQGPTPTFRICAPRSSNLQGSECIIARFFRCSLHLHIRYVQGAMLQSVSRNFQYLYWRRWHKNTSGPYTTRRLQFTENSLNTLRGSMPMRQFCASMRIHFVMFGGVNIQYIPRCHNTMLWFLVFPRTWSFQNSRLRYRVHLTKQTKKIS